MRYGFFLILVVFRIVAQAQNNEPKLILPVGHTDGVVSAQFSPDGKKIATNSHDNTVKIWDAESGKILIDIVGHSKYVVSVEFSPDCSKIVTASWDSTAKIWDIETGKLYKVLSDHSNRVNSAKFSPNGRNIVTTSRDKTAKIWDAKTGKLLTNLVGHTSEIYSAQFSPDGNKIVTASGDNTAKIWDVKSGKFLADIVGHTYQVYTALFSPNGQRIVTISLSDTIKIWDAESGKLLTALIGHTERVNSVQFSANGKKVLSASSDNTVKIWDAESGKLLTTLNGHTARVNSAQFSPDGKKIITASYDNTSRLWDVQTERQLIVFTKQFQFGVNSAQFSPDGQIVVTASDDNSARIWNVESGNLLADLSGHSSIVFSAQFSPDNHKIVTASWDNNSRIWDLETGKILANLSNVNSAQFSPDGSKIITSSEGNSCKIWDVSTRKILAYVGGYCKVVSTTNFSPDGKKIVTTSGNETVRVWDVETVQLLHILSRHNSWLTSAKFSPNGKMIVTISDDTLKIWNSESGKLLIVLPNNSYEINSVEFSPDSRKVATSSDNLVKIWDVESGKLLTILDGDHLDNVISTEFSPDGKKILTTNDNTTMVWDVETGRNLVSLIGPLSYLVPAKYSPDGKKIITSSFRLAKIWNSETGKPLVDLQDHSSWVNSAEFSQDGKLIITASNDNTTKVWNAEKGELLYTLLAIDSSDYLVYDKDYRYDGTEGAKKMLYFTCGSEIIELNQLKDLCWEPDLAAKIMGVNKEPITAKKLSEINICNFTPQVEDKGLGNGFYHYIIKARDGGLGEVQVFVNDKLIMTKDSAKLKFIAGTCQFKISITEVAPYFTANTENKVMVKATTRKGNMSSRGAVILNNDIKKVFTNPNIFIVSIGVSAYKGDKLKLRYASKDAVDFAAVLKVCAQKLLNTDQKEHVSSYVFHTEPGSSHWPSKFAIQKTMDSLARVVKADDIVVIFFGGHGVLVNGEKKNLYLLTAEASSFDLGGVEKEVAISTLELNQWMRNIKANKQLLILDACNSGQMVQNMQELMASRDVPADQQRALDDLKEKTGTYILSASASGQSAYETSLFDHGLLTQSLLSSIKLGNGLKDNNYIDVTKWFNAAVQDVKLLAKDIGGRQDPQTLGSASFQIGMADDEIKNGIKLSIKKKIFKRSIFIKTGRIPSDNLGLAIMVDKELNEVSAKGGNSSFTFIPDNTFQEADSVNGSYTVTENKISASIFLIIGNNEESVFQFELMGELDKKEDLAKSIVQKINDFLSK